MNTFDAVDKVRPYRIWEGAVARAVRGERLTMAVVDIAADVAVPEHRHENEQVGMVLQGSITMTVGGESRDLKPGETYVIPSNVPHAGLAGPNGVSVVDIFAPVRSDWESAERGEPGPGAWPT